MSDEAAEGQATAGAGAEKIEHEGEMGEDAPENTVKPVQKLGGIPTVQEGFSRAIKELDQLNRLAYNLAMGTGSVARPGFDIARGMMQASNSLWATQMADSLSSFNRTMRSIVGDPFSGQTEVIRQLAGNVGAQRTTGFSEMERLLGGMNRIGPALFAAESRQALLLGIPSFSEGVLGSQLGLSEAARRATASSFRGYSKSFAKILDAPTPILPELRKPSAWSYFSTGDLMEAISVPEEERSSEPEKQALRQEVAEGTRDALTVLLAELDPALMTPWQGGLIALRSDNPDRARHFLASVRELFTQVLHRLAPDDRIRAWNMSEENFDKLGRPTRRARVLYIMRNLDGKAFKEFVKKDVDNVLAMVDLFQRMHQIDVMLSDAEGAALRIRTECALRLMIEVSRTTE